MMRRSAIVLLHLTWILLVPGRASAEGAPPPSEGDRTSAVGSPEAEADAPASERDERRDSHELAPDERLADHVRRAREHLEQQDYANARAEFVRALAYAATDADRATLEFNAASCAYKLADHADAERRFARSAALDPGNAALAWLNAALSALERGQDGEAARYLQNVERGDADLERRRAAVEREIERVRAARAASWRDGLVRRSAEALQRGDAASAVLLLEEVLALPDPVAPAEVADVHYGLAAAHLELGQLRRARLHIDLAIALSPADPELYLKRAQIELRVGARRAAARDLERALAFGLTGKHAERARAELAALDPRPATKATAALYAGGGLDSNPAQSGIAETTDVGAGASSKASAFTALSGELGYTGRIGRRTALRLEYLPSAFALLAPEVQSLSLQAHEGGLHLYVAASRSTLFRMSALSSYLLAGLGPVEPFVWENGAALRVDARTGDHARTRLGAEARAVYGYPGQEAMSGARGELGVSELLESGDLEWTLSARLRGTRAGEWTLAAGELPACAALFGAAICAEAVYHIPLSYVAPMASVDLLWSVAPRLALGVSAGLELRSYLEESFMQAGSRAGSLRRLSGKRRQDVRLKGSARAELALDAEEHLVLSSSYGVLGSHSNVAYDADDPEHSLDYDDRRFVQHLLELGIEARF